MTTIVTRSGKGSPLTHTEVDTNFTNLNTAKLETAAIPLGTLQAPSISFLNYSTTGIYSPAGNELGVSMLGSDKIRIKSTGEIIINATASRTTLGITPRLQIEGSASSSQCSLSLTGAGAGSSLIPRLYLSKARSSVNAVVLEDDILGLILFNGGDGSSLVNAGFIKAEVDGTPSAGIVPGRLVFATVDTAGGTGERMIIKNNGNVSIDGTTFHVDAVNNRVGIGTSSPGSFNSFANNLVVGTGIGANGITVYGGPSSTSTLNFADGTDGSDSFPGYITYNHADNNLSFIVNYAGNSAARMFISSAGNVGIGTTIPQFGVDLRRGSGLDAYFLAAGNNNGTTNGILFGQDATGLSLIYQYGANPITFWTNADERARIDSSGRLLVGTSSAFDTSFIDTNYQIGIEKLNAYAGFAMKANHNTGDGCYILLAKSRGSSLNTKTVVNDGDTIGAIVFEGADGTNMRRAAQITCLIDGTPGADDMPGRLVFSTTADGAASPTERMRIKSDGDVSIVTGNLIIGTAGKGIDFSADGSAAGMTSELLDDYEEGTFVPTAGAGITTNSGTPAYSGFYTKIGRLVHVTITQTAGNITATVGAGVAFTNLPFAPGFQLQACSVTNGNPNISGTALIYDSAGTGAIFIGFTVTSQTNLTITGTYFT